MKKTTIYLDDETDDRLTELSLRHTRSRAALIRDAVERMIAADTRPPSGARRLGVSEREDTFQRTG